MKRKGFFKKALIYTVIGATVAGNTMPALAYTNSTGAVNETQDVSTNDTAECEVYAELGTEFKVIIPKKITLSGSSKSGSYTVDVEGDIGGTDTVKVVPEESFTLTSTGLADQIAKVSQDKTAWSWNEILSDSKTIGNGSISASGITAGVWNGSFWFNISLEESSGTEDSKVEISMDDDTTKNITIDAGDSVQIDIFVGDENVNDEVTWSSDNENVTVQNGLIEVSESVTDGETANITATIGDKSITVIITINKKQKESLKLSTSDVAMGVNDSVQVNAYLDGVIANDKVTWSSDNENITVTNGLIESTASAQVGDTATVTVTANDTENLSAMANVLSDLGIVTYASAAEDLSIDFVVTIVDIEYSVEELNLKAGESIDVTARIIPNTVTGTVTWSQTAVSGINLVKNGNTVTVKVASDMEAGKTYNLIATYGDYSKTLKINIVPDHVHSYDAGIVTTEPTCTEDGVKTFTCSKCNGTTTESVNKLGHNYSSVVTAPTCTKEGYTTHTCSRCNDSYVDSKVAATGHSFGSPIYVWSADRTSCTATRNCSNCSYYESEKVSSTNTITKAATCTESGIKTYTAPFHCTGFKYQTVTVDIPATGHNYVNDICTICGEEKIYEAGLYDADGVMLCTWEESGFNNTCSNAKTVLSKYPTATKVVISDSVTSIGNYAFERRTSLTSIEIPDSVTSIGNYAFDGCTGLTSITIPKNVASIGNDAFRNCMGKAIINCNIPSSTSYSNAAFYNSKFTEVIISNGVTSIGDGAFYGCTGLTSVKLPDSITSIGSSAFYGCTGLTSVKLPDSITSIGSSAFNGCTGLTSIKIPEGVTSIEYYAFYNCTSLTSIGPTGSGSSVELPDSVTYLGQYSFGKCSKLTNIVIPDSVTEIVVNAFDGCTGLISTTIGSGVTKIGGSDAFRNCTGELIVNCNIPNGASSYGPFTGSKFTKVTIGDDVTSIGLQAFYNCSSLTSVTIGSSVNSIERSAFYGCTNLTSVAFKNTNEWYIGASKGTKTTAINSSDLTNTSTAATYLSDTYGWKYWTNNSVELEAGLYDKDGNLLCTWEESGIDVEMNYSNSSSDTNYYQTSTTSGYYVLTNNYPTTTKVIFPDSVTSVGDWAFYYCRNLISIEVSDSVTNIGNSAFSECTSLVGVIMGNSMNSIGENAFSYCSSLTDIIIPDSVESIGNYAFSGCYYLTNVTIGNNVTSIGNYAFSGCYEELTSIDIPESVTSIGEYAFRGCKQLTRIEIPKGVTSIGSGTFSECTSLTSVTIPSSVTSIGERAFYKCTSLISITIPESVISIGDWAFYDCTGNVIINCNIPSASSYSSGAFYRSKFTKVTIGDSVTSIGDYAFRSCKSLTSVIIPESVTSIGHEAFAYCEKLTSITIPKNVTSIGDGAFYDCTNLTSATFNTTSGWYVGASAGAKTTLINSSNLANTSTAATYLKTTYSSKYWTR